MRRTGVRDQTWETEVPLLNREATQIRHSLISHLAGGGSTGWLIPPSDQTEVPLTTSEEGPPNSKGRSPFPWRETGEREHWEK